MTTTVKGQGTCLCGSVQFYAEHAKCHTGACHCNMCVKWGGGPYLAVDCGTDVRFEGEQHIERYCSSVWAERGFCKRCGTHLFYHLKGADVYNIPPGVFDDQSQFQLTQQIFVDKKPAHYNLAEKTEMLSEAEVFARSAAQS